ncbi:hypothetical protein [Salinisphaera sp. T31B1]|uniref:hypothetical protein n=1 Tax=Salinisphaera sp. T31B1 TaxID=727963 RepID=UPI0033413D9F
MKKGLVLAIVVLLIAGAGYWLMASPPASAPEPNAVPATQAPDTNTATPPAEAGQSAPEPNAAATDRTSPDEGERSADNAKAPPPAPKDFCARDFADIQAREDDAQALAAAGGLVHIFEREAQLADPYGCADFYLEHGLDIDAVDPRPDHDRLTGLFFAIKRNDPKMVHFMIDHGADLDKRAGRKDTKALGYAYYLALQDQRINRNEVIGILDSTLTEQSAAATAGDTSRP